MLVDINGLPDLDHVARRRRRRAGRCAGPARRRARRRRRTPGAAAARRWRWPTSPTPTIRNRGTTVGSLVHADAAAEMPVVLRAARRLASTSRRAAAAGARSPPTTCSSARWSRTLAPRRDRGRGVLPGARRRRRRRLRGDRPPARRLRAVRRRRAGRSTATRARPAPATSRSATCPTVVDLTEALDGAIDATLAGRRGGARASSSPADDIHATARLPRAAGPGAHRPRASVGVRRRRERWP